MTRQQETEFCRLRRAVIDGDVRTGSLMAGQVAGMLREVRPVRAILEEMNRDCLAVMAGLRDRRIDHE